MSGFSSHSWISDRKWCCVPTDWCACWWCQRFGILSPEQTVVCHHLWRRQNHQGLGCGNRAETVHLWRSRSTSVLSLSSSQGEYSGGSSQRPSSTFSILMWPELSMNTWATWSVSFEMWVNEHWSYLDGFCMQFIFSTAIDGKIKAWLYDLLGSRVDYDAPGHWCTTMAYSADGTR